MKYSKIKNGFTLVELLGVLLIIGILSAITIPIVTDSINKSQNSIYKNQEKIILKGAMNWASVNTSELPYLSDDDKTESIAITLGRLKANGYITGELKNPKTGYLYPDDMIINITYDTSNEKIDADNVKYNGNYKFEFDEESGTELNLENNIPATNLNVCESGFDDDNETIQECIQNNLDIIYQDLKGNALNPNNVDLSYYYSSNKPVDDIKTYNYKSNEVTAMDMSKYGFYYVYYTNIGSENASFVRIFMINDTEAPILNFSENYQTKYTIGATIDLHDNVTCTDNSGYCTFRVSGNIMPSVEGKYVLKYIATDNSGNVTTVKKVVEIKESLLPVAYQQVEYIESTGTQYIDTGFIPNQDTGVITEASYSTSSNVMPFFGAAISYNNKSFESYIDGGRFQINYNSSNSNLQTGLNSNCINKKFKLIIKKNCAELFWIDDNNKFSYETTYENFESPYTMTIFALHRANLLYGNVKVYYFYIYDDDILIRSLIPCYRKSDGEIGMYDTVTKEFFTNQGTGTFLKGPDVNK